MTSEEEVLNSFKKICKDFGFDLTDAKKFGDISKIVKEQLKEKGLEDITE